MTINHQCAHVKPGGQRCQASSLSGSVYCYFHDPAKAKHRAAARRAGGRKRAQRTVVLPPDTPDLELKSLADVAGCLAVTINQVRRGELDVKIANAVGYLAATLGKVLETSDLEKRLADLEAREAARRQRRQAA
jgi:hypothetical protein